MLRAIVLAAGKSTRMKTDVPKVLHEICGRPLLWYVLGALRAAGITDIYVVTNPQLHERISDFGVQAILQPEQLGTGHAVQIALQNLPVDSKGQILIACGDMPLVQAELFRGLVASLGTDRKTSLALVTAKMALPSNFGRVVRQGARVQRIVEARDATGDQLQIDEMNAGIYAFDESALREAVGALRTDNAQREYYLTDTVDLIARKGGRIVPVIAGDHLHVLGINDRVELARARDEMNRRLCEQHMRDGVTIIDPNTTYLEPELALGRDTVIYPNTMIGRLSRVGERCTIGPNARLSAAELGAHVTVQNSVIFDSAIGDDATVGPFAHIRGDARLERGVHIGNFVEVKNSHLAADVKASHLSYIGDATIGERTNIGAGTITCNFDGRKKNRTTIGKDVSIGSNTSLVAPVNVGDGALTGASSVVTKDVPAGERVAGNPARPLPKK
ncbi:MAG: bifunctional UDP-N-acetylglucosamine diphosphorylase/glucosamine-1-phosphate N-acetyltransferase GlmU [Candidatus Eremiobacteraeota bacterium]|nr:bifunctional UDP-N-acetylglucosamine diphosphorylase/glucosamine-1-phosphate N-acetyltransferase GlmU [Candidatus Eremiobacteraeota bacterium]